MQTTASSQTSRNTDSALEKVAFEWNGVLAKHVGAKSLFSLYLAMHDAREPHTVKLQTEQQAQSNELLQGLNFYRKSNFSIDQQAVQQHSVQSELRKQKHYSSAWLQECLHPTPIHHRNDSTFIDKHIKLNASFACQQKLATENTQQDSELPLDATLLADIVESAQTML